MDTAIITMLLGFVVGLWTSVMVLHALAVLRDRREQQRLQPILDELYPFLQISEAADAVTQPCEPIRKPAK